MTCCLFLSLQVINAQSVISMQDCRILEATFTTQESITSNIFILEQEVAPQVWRKMKSIETVESQVTFPLNEIGKYRVLNIPSFQDKTIDNATIFQYADKTTKESPTAFISNEILLNKVHFNCEKNHFITEDLNIQKLNLYPNPVTDQLILENIDLEQLHRIQVLSIGGEILQTYAPNQRIDVAHLVDGVYILQCIGEDVFIAEKFVKTK